MSTWLVVLLVLTCPIWIPFAFILVIAILGIIFYIIFIILVIILELIGKI
jgi:hypothetical protein